MQHRAWCALAAIGAIGTFEAMAEKPPGKATKKAKPVKKSKQESIGRRGGKLLASIGWLMNGDEWEEALATARHEWLLDSRGATAPEERSLAPLAEGMTWPREQMPIVRPVYTE